MRNKILTLIISLFCVFAKAQSPVSANILTLQTPCMNDGKLKVIYGGGTAPYTVKWYRQNTIIACNTDSLVNAPVGNYIVHVWDALGNFGFATYNMPGVFTPSYHFYEAHCPATDGAASIQLSGGTPPYTFSWSNGQTMTNSTGYDSIGNLTAGAYFCIITDSTGCGMNTAYDTSGIVANATPIQVAFTIRQDSCNDGAIKANTSGGLAPYSYFWSFSGLSGDSISGLDVGTYGVQITDSNGCYLDTFAYVHPEIHHVQSNYTQTPATCPLFNDGSIQLNVFAGVPPFQIQWNTGDTTLFVDSLSMGQYSVLITDARGCHITAHKYVSGTITVQASIINPVSADCNYTNGSLTAIASGIHPPFSYVWSNGDTNSVADTLAPGYYTVTVTDALGCSDTYGYTLPLADSCMAIISGTVVNDMNANCVMDPSESGIANRIIDLGNGEFMTTNFMGTYEYKTLNFGPMNVSHTPPAAWNMICPSPGSYSINAVSNSNFPGTDFFTQAQNSTDDLVATCQVGIVRPGFTHRTYFTLKNKGTNTISGNINYIHDTIETLVNMQPGLQYNAATRQLSSPSFLIAPDAYFVFYADFTISATTALNTPVKGIAIALPNSNDNTPLDNTDTCNTFVVGSYDPNDKLVVPSSRVLPYALYDGDSVLTYTVRCQNTGNYPTSFIRIVDTLDADLNVSSFEFLGASHAGCRWEISGPGVVSFIWDSIALPGALVDEPGSHGWIKYRIKLKSGLPAYTLIHNTAHIFFDYNTAIVTNTTINQTTPVILNSTTVKVAEGFICYPNPANETCRLHFDTEEEGRIIRIIDFTGREVKRAVVSQKEYLLDVSAVAPGVYLANVISENGKKSTSVKLTIKH